MPELGGLIDSVSSVGGLIGLVGGSFGVVAVFFFMILNMCSKTSASRLVAPALSDTSNPWRSIRCRGSNLTEVKNLMCGILRILCLDRKSSALNVSTSEDHERGGRRATYCLHIPLLLPIMLLPPGIQSLQLLVSTMPQHESTPKRVPMSF